MNKLKYFILASLCFALLGGANGAFSQSSQDKVLVSGKNALRQSDIDSMIKFYEWAFEARFTDDERERFQDMSVQSFREDPAAGRKSTDTIITSFERLKQKSEEEQAKLKASFSEGFIGDLRRAGDESAALLVAIYDRAKGDGGTVASSAADEPTVTEDKALPLGRLSDIAGKWAWGRSGSTTKTVTGVYLGGNASRFTYDISANGSVAFTGIMTSMTGGCKLTAFNARKGRASLVGDRLTIIWGPTSFSRDDTCSPAKNYKKTLPAETEVFSVSIQNSYGQKQLCLTGKDETCFTPEN